MNKPHKHAEIIKAWADGASIEVRDPFNPMSEWRTINPPRWADNLEYRVKPEPKLIPFTFEDADKLIGKAIIDKTALINSKFHSVSVFLITEINNNGFVKLGNKTNSMTHLNDLLSYYVFLDGSPCGKTVNE